LQPARFVAAVAEFYSLGDFTHMLRFLIHICLTAVVAPALGAAAYLLLDGWAKGDLDGESISRTMMFAGLGGLYALIFIWFQTLPFGVVSSFICYRMAQSKSVTLPLWIVVCTVLGIGFGAFMGFWSSTAVPKCALIGAVLGAASGCVLRKVWTYDRARVA
jgi:hypothetical protein